MDRSKTTTGNYNQRVEKFTWKYHICRYDLPYAIVTDNNTQFKHLVTSIEHPQTNGQAEAANRVILKALRTRLDKSKGLWKEELYNMLWAYTIVHPRQQLMKLLTDSHMTQIS